MKVSHLLIPVVALAAILTGCGNQKLTTTKSQYPVTNMAATIKGTAKNSDHITYQVDDGKNQTVKVNSDNFFFTVPAKTAAQTVTIKAGSQEKKVTVGSQTKLGSYKQVAKKYNTQLVQANLPKKLIAKAQAAQKNQKSEVAKIKALAKTNPQQAMAQQQKLVAAGKQLQTEIKTATVAATTKVKNQKLPAVSEGLKTNVTTANYQIRTNVDHDALLSMGLIIPTNKLKTTAGQKSFGTTLALLANSTGADAKKVIKDFGNQVKKQKNNQSSTQTHTITSNGVNFKTAVSVEKIYIFITK